MRKLLNRKIRQQGGMCAICHEEFTDYNDIAPEASGDIDNVRTIPDDLEKPVTKRYVLSYNIAKIYAVMVDAEKAFVWLDTSYKEGNPDLIELNSEPVFDGIRADSRFRELMQRVGWKV